MENLFRRWLSSDQENILWAIARERLDFGAWLRAYRPNMLPGDIVAGLTVAVMLIPQSMAYALLAGLPPIIGLYASIFPVLIYGLLSSTGILTVGPTAITSVMTLSIIGSLGEPGTEAFIVLGFTLALTLGAVYLLMGLFRAGFIINLLSQPVLVAYVNAAAIIILISQIGNLLGITVERSPYPHMILWRTVQNLTQLNLSTLAIGIGSLALLLYFKHALDRVLQRLGWPPMARFVLTRSGPLLAALLATLLVFALRLDTQAGVAIIGTIPRGLPELTTNFDLASIRPMVPGALAIAFVGFMEAISTANSLMTQNPRKINANQELIALGASNVASALSGGLPVTTSISRSAVNHGAGANTGLSSVIAAGMLALTVILLTPIFYYLPNAVLAAIIISSVVSLIDPASFRWLWRSSHAEAGVATITMVSVLIFSIEMGLLVGIGLMLALFVYRTSRIELTSLGRIGYTERYTDLRNNEALPIPHTMIVRVEESLFFANSQNMDRTLRNQLSEYETLRFLILDFSAVNTLDVSALYTLNALARDLHARDIQIFLVAVKAKIRERSDYGNNPFLRSQHFDNVHAAVEATGQLVDHLLPL